MADSVIFSMVIKMLALQSKGVAKMALTCIDFTNPWHLAGFAILAAGTGAVTGIFLFSDVVDFEMVDTGTQTLLDVVDTGTQTLLDVVDAGTQTDFHIQSIVSINGPTCVTKMFY